MNFVFISLTERIFVFSFLCGSRISPMFYDVFFELHFRLFLIFRSFLSNADGKMTASHNNNNSNKLNHPLEQTEIKI